MNQIYAGGENYLETETAEGSCTNGISTLKVSWACIY
jgi:hypothetical protein